METAYKEFLATLGEDVKDKERQALIDAWYDSNGLARGLYDARTEEPSANWSIGDLQAEFDSKGLKHDAHSADAGKMGLLWLLNPKAYPVPGWVTKAIAKQKGK